MPRFTPASPRSARPPEDRPWLITGVAGFIGSHLAGRLLRSGARVVGLDNFDSFYARSLKEGNLASVREAASHDDRARGERFTFVEGDILDAGTVRRLVVSHQPRMIVHIAALAGVRPSLADPLRYMRVNVEGLSSVLEAVRVFERERETSRMGILFASSSSVYGNNPKTPFSECDPVDTPISPYAASKRAGELLCQTYARVYGLRIAALRFFTVYGPAQRPDLAISKFMQRIAMGESIEVYGDGSTSRDYTYIDDIVDGVLAAGGAVRGDRLSACAGEIVESGGGGGYFRIFNLGGSRPHTLSETIDAIAGVVGRAPIVNRQPMQPGDVERTWADLARSSAELGFEPRIDLESGLRAQWAWLESRLGARV